MESKHRYIQHQIRRNAVTIHEYESRLLIMYMKTVAFGILYNHHITATTTLLAFFFSLLQYRRSHHIFHNGNIVLDQQQQLYFLFPHQKQMLHYIEAVIEHTISMNLLLVQQLIFFLPMVSFICQWKYYFISLVRMMC